MIDWLAMALRQDCRNVCPTRCIFSLFFVIFIVFFFFCPFVLECYAAGDVDSLDSLVRFELERGSGITRTRPRTATTTDN